jgi:glycogen operon protein
MLSQGVPMMVMGDEVRRTQKGNNNAYCQDNEISWFDWNLVDKNKDLFRFWKQLIALRLRHATAHRSCYFTGAVNERGLADLTWHGCELNQPNWDDPNARALAATSGGMGDAADIHVMMNMYWEPLTFAIPSVPGRKWYRAIDTNLASPNDIATPDQETEINVDRYLVGGRSVVVLISK